MRLGAVLIAASLACIVLVSLLATAAAQETETGPPGGSDQSTPPSGGDGGMSANATSTPPILPTPPPGAAATAALDPPPAPGSFSASVTGRTSVSLTSQVQSGIGAHHLAYRVNLTGQSWTRVDLGASVGSYDVSGLTCGTSYRFAVKARGDGTNYERVWGAYARTTASTSPCPTPAPSPTPPAPPTNLTLVLEDDGDLRVDYTESALGRHHFELQRSASSGGAYSHYQYRNDDASPARFYAPAGGYYYKARGRSCRERDGVNCGNWTPFSNTVWIPGGTSPQPTPTPTPAPPSLPKPTVTGLQSSTSMTSITFTWNEGPSGTSYEISRLVDGGDETDENDWVWQATIIGSSFEDTGLTCRTSYTYRIRAKKGSLVGNYVKRTVTTAACECDSYNLVDSNDAANILAPPITGSRPRMAEESSGRDSTDRERYPEYACTSTVRNAESISVFYPFRTQRELHLHFKLSAPHANPKLILWRSGSVVVENDDTDEVAGSQDSQIAQLIVRGQYILEVTVSDSRTSSYDLDVIVSEAMPAFGHQSDYVVQYEVGASMPTSGPEATLFPWAITQAADKWDTKATASTPKVRFCHKVEPGIVPGEGVCPAGANADGTTVDVARVTNQPCFVRRNPNNPNDDEDGYACAHSATSGGHMTSRYIWIELPSNVKRLENGMMVDYEVKWHDVAPLDHHQITSTRTLYVYLRRVVMHEFGHTAGLVDLDNYPVLGPFTGFVMSYGTKKTTTVPDRDIEYLKQVYRNDHGASPH